MEASHTQNPPNQRHASLRASPAACESFARSLSRSCRIRQAAEGVDREGFADRAAALREGREAEERHTAQEAAREQERVKELERRQQEIEREAHRDRGHGIDR